MYATVKFRVIANSFLGMVSIPDSNCNKLLPTDRNSAFPKFICLQFKTTRYDGSNKRATISAKVAIFSSLAYFLALIISMAFLT